MTKEQFQRETQFNSSLAVAKSMLQRDLISGEEYAKIREMFVQKYRPSIGCLSPYSLDFVVE